MAESLPPRKTCSTCRTRKVRCDGQEPCGRCTRVSRGSPECVYDDLRTPEKDDVPVLTKGSACFPCRRKKKRCNGERPVCATCIAVGKPGTCEYEEGQTFTLALLKRTRELEERLAAVTGRTCVAEHPPGLDTSNEVERALAEFQVREVPVPSPMNQIFPAEGLVPSILANLNEFRKLFIQHRCHFCFSMQGPRMYALLSGDSSGEFAHPAMINAAELLGFVMWQEQHGQFSLLTEEYLLHLTNESLATLEHSLVHQGFDMKKFCSAMHVYCAIALYHFLGRRLPSFQDSLKQAVDLVQLVGAEHLVTMLMAAPIDPSLLDAGSYSESRNAQEECVAAIAQIIFLDRSAVVMLDLQPVCPDLESILNNLRNTSVVWKTNLNLLRSRSASLAHAGRRLWVAWNLENQSETARATLTKRYWVLMEDLVEHIGVLKVAQLRASLANDEVQIAPLKSSLLTAMCTESSLRHLINDPESRRLALESIRDAVSISETIKEEELDYLDPILGASLAFAGRVLFLERKRAKEEPLQTLALQDDMWTAQAVRALGRVFVHLELKMPYVAQARTIVDACCDGTEKLIPGPG